MQLEKRTECLEKTLDTLGEDFVRFVKASKKDWRDLRNFLTKMIEGN